MMQALKIQWTEDGSKKLFMFEPLKDDSIDINPLLLA